LKLRFVRWQRQLRQAPRIQVIDHEAR